MATIKDTLIDLFELDKMEPEKANEMVNRLANLVFQATLARALPMLSEEDFEKYEQMMDKEEGPEVMFKFLGEKIPAFENIIAEEAKLLRDELAGEMEAAGM